MRSRARSARRKKESHKITHRSGRHNTELDLLVVRQQQLRRVKDCKALAGEYVTTQHTPVVFEDRIKKWKEKRTMGPKHWSPSCLIDHVSSTLVVGILP